MSCRARRHLTARFLCGFPCLVQEAQAEHDAGAGQAQGEGHPDTGQAGLLNCYSIQKIQSTLFFMN